MTFSEAIEMGYIEEDTCPNCDADIEFSWVCCPYCGEEL